MKALPAASNGGRAAVEIASRWESGPAETGGTAGPASEPKRFGLRSEPNEKNGDAGSSGFPEGSASSRNPVQIGLFHRPGTGTDRNDLPD